MNQVKNPVATLGELDSAQTVDRLVTRQCLDCRRYLPSSEFYEKRPGRLEGLCKQCKKERRQARNITAKAPPRPETRLVEAESGPPASKSRVAGAGASAPRLVSAAAVSDSPSLLSVLGQDGFDSIVDCFRALSRWQDQSRKSAIQRALIMPTPE